MDTAPTRFSSVALGLSYQAVLFLSCSFPSEAVGFCSVCNPAWQVEAPAKAAFVGSVGGPHPQQNSTSERTWPAGSPKLSAWLGENHASSNGIKCIIIINSPTNQHVVIVEHLEGRKRVPAAFPFKAHCLMIDKSFNCISSAEG